jgi:inosine-uridine nucleoside N-ribohydrolase
VIVLGASANVASALLIAPEIAAKLRVYLLGTGYDEARGVWSKLDFNCMMDPRAIHVLLDTEGLSRVLWDLARVEAAIRPELSREITVRTPPENRQREVRVYASIDAGRMRQTSTSGSRASRSRRRAERSSG